MKKLISAWFFCLLAAMSLCLAGCEKTEVEDPDDPDDPNIETPDEPTPPQQELTFEFGDVAVTRFTAEYTVTPSDETATYLSSIVLVDVIENGYFEDNAESLYRNEKIETLERYTEALIHDRYLKTGKLDNNIFKGETLRTIGDTGMEPGEEYYAYAVGYDKASNSFTSDFATVRFSLEPLAEPLFVFDVDEIGPSSAHFFVQPNAENGEIPYLVQLTTADYFDNDCEGSGVTFINKYIDANMRPNVAGDGNYAPYLTYGPEPAEATLGGLTANTEYVLVAAGVDVIGYVYSKAVVERFTTAEVVPSENTFELWDDKGVIHVATANDDPYVLAVFATETVEGKTSEELTDMVLSYYNMNNVLADNIFSGSQKFNFSKYVDAFGDYTVVIFGYEGGRTTDVTTYDYSFQEADRSEYTNLTSDFEYNASEDENGLAYGYPQVSLAYYGDFYDNGGDNYVLIVSGYDASLQVEFVTGAVEGFKEEMDLTLDIDGDGLFSYSTNKAYGGIYYFNGQYDDFAGTWVYGIYNDEFWGDGEAAADKGTVSIKLGEFFEEWDDWYGEYWREYGEGSVVADFTDPQGNNVKYTADSDYIFCTDYSEISYSLYSVSEARPVNVRATLDTFSTLSKMERRAKLQELSKSRAASHLNFKKQMMNK